MDDNIRKDFDRDDAERQESLERARLCASLTKPWVLPPSGYSPNDKLPEPFSSLPARACSNLEGKLLTALFPAAQPFFKLRPAGRFRFDPNVEPEKLSEFENILHLQELMILAKLDRTDKQSGSNSRRAGFRSRMRLAISQLLITGDVLIQLTDDFNIKVFRRDNYVTKRDSAGDILYHIIREQIDPLTLTKSQLEDAGMDFEALQLESVDRRMEDLYTKVQWNPLSKVWVISQEINDHVVYEAQEPITPFMSTPYSLAPAANYGEGIIGENLGDVRSHNELTERILDFGAIASKQIFCLDYNSQVRPSDLALPTGSVIQARVQGGAVTDVGMLRADKLTDFNVVATTRESIRKDLTTVMLMEGESMPTYERATRLHVQRVAQEIEGALGGVYAPIADSMQISLIERMRHVMTLSGDLPPLPEETVEVQAVTGLMALSNETEKMKLVELMQLIAQLGPEVGNRIDKGVLLDVLVRQTGIYEPGLVKTEEQVNQEMQAAQQQAMEQQAASTAMDAVGRGVASGNINTGEMNV